MNNIHYKFAYTFYVYTRLGNARINKKAHLFSFLHLPWTQITLIYFTYMIVSFLTKHITPTLFGTKCKWCVCYIDVSGWVDAYMYVVGTFKRKQYHGRLFVVSACFNLHCLSVCIMKGRLSLFIVINFLLNIWRLNVFLVPWLCEALGNLNGNWTILQRVFFVANWKPWF